MWESMEEGAPLLGERRVKPKGTSVKRVAALAVSALGTAALIAVVGVSVMSARNPGAAREAVSELGAGSGVTEIARRALGPMCTEDDRLMPTVFLIGVEKCGTTSLYDDMISHIPALRPMHDDEGAPAKEMRYFDTGGRFVNMLKWNKDPTPFREWLTRHADTCAAVASSLANEMSAHGPEDPFDMAASRTQRLHVDGTPAYFNAGVGAKIAEAYPRPEQRRRLRFVATVCDPETRLKSAFTFFKTLYNGWGGEQAELWEKNLYTHYFATYADWLAQTVAALPQASAPGGLFDNPGAQMAETLDDDAEDVDDANGESVGDLGRKERAERRRMKNLFNEVVKTRYESVLREYLDAGFSADQFLVLPNSYYFERPADALRDIASHVGVDARDLDAIGDAAHANAGRVEAEQRARLVGHVRERDREALREHLRPQLEGLRKLHCEEGLKMAAWHGVREEERDRYWSFMPKGPAGDCETARAS